VDTDTGIEGFDELDIGTEIDEETGPEAGEAEDT
jgi:hypothetical protein